jgi:rod shape-determining protein MreC
VRNIFLFIRRYSTLLFFLLLQGFSIWLIVSYNKHHRAAFTNTANQLTGKVSAQYNKIEDYFHLKAANDSLMAANEKLYNKLRDNYQLPDTISKTFIDSISTDSIKRYQRYTYLRATVLENSVTSQSNYIVLGRGKKQDIKEDMGVVDENGNVVGVITVASDDYAVVMSVLHKDSRIDGKLYHTGETGTISWDGVAPNIVSMSRIPKSAKVVKGDSIITSGNSSYFPKGLFVGYVTDVTPEKSNNNYAIKLKTAADFYNLQYVYIISNKEQTAIKNLLDSAAKINR